MKHEPHWRRMGFGSFEEYHEALKQDQERLDRKFWRRRRSGDPPAGSLPGGEIGRLGAVRRAPVRQVGIKLRPAGYDALSLAARRYGIRPSTMARLLVNRGVRAVLERD